MLCGSTAFHGFASVAESFAVVTFDLSICRGGGRRKQLESFDGLGGNKKIEGNS